MISIYRYIIKPFLGGRASCRFSPSCSEYAAQSFKAFSVLKAIKLTALRLSKCHPLGSYGYDPIPVKPSEKTA